MTKNTLSKISVFARLPQQSQQFLRMVAEKHPFTFQQLRMLTEYSVDLYCWHAGSLEQFYQPEHLRDISNKKEVTVLFEQFRSGYESLKNGIKKYPERQYALTREWKPAGRQIVQVQQQGNIMGLCPVVSEKTRCCKLRTLDAVQQCGFDCSYCSIQSFYHGGEVRFVENLGERLAALDIDASRLYHIGTGQSSDSLMWGNRFGLLDTLCRFARQHPNVILEMKSKSGRINYFLENHPPPNVVCTWSLNPPVVIAHEEKGTATLEIRIQSARKLADRKIPVGFHFHPIVWYEGWQEDYLALVKTLVNTFAPEEVVMVSLGTLTFIKSVLKRIRSRMLESSILQMPMEECAGKFSYPFSIKQELFRTVYAAFPQSWKSDVFFYMCMESIDLWEPVFGYSYLSNDQFEQEMLTAYHAKIRDMDASLPR
ncbi:MAG: DNA photolyase [Desulfobulbus propionicus]|nr:MAG: DNA photolyase [Desulfobulbus propionicus]